MKKGKSNPKIHCRHCGNEYNQKHVENVFGKFSMPATLGYCSASCYTKSLTGTGTKDVLFSKGEWKKRITAKIIVENTERAFRRDIIVDGIGVVAISVGHSLEEAEDNAERIIKAVNMHNELIDFISSLDLSTTYEIKEKAKELLKQAEQYQSK